MLEPAAAALEILSHARRLEAVDVPLLEASGMVLSRNAVSPIDLPAWDNSAMDGYALNSKVVDLESPIAVVAEIAAGSFPDRDPGPGECSRIFTGAPIPANCDTVIRQEDVTITSSGSIVVNDDRDLRRNIRRRGEDLTKGDMVLTAGTELNAARLGVLASMAMAEAPVFRAPRVALLGSGDEIAELDEAEEILAGRKIASSNSYTLTTLIREAGGVPVNFGIARDDPRDLTRRLSEAAKCDLIVTSAGVSVGDHDYVREVLEDMGTDMKFWRIRMRPGSPVGHGLLKGVPWIGLPGNPVSCMVTFELLVRPVIRKMMGKRLPFRRTLPVRLGEEVRISSSLTHFLRVRLERTPDGPVVFLTGPQGSGILTSMAMADALLIVPHDRPVSPAGSELRALVLHDPVHVERPDY